MVFAETINVNHHSVPQVNDELINSFKIFVMFIGSLMFQRKYYKKNLNGVGGSTHDEWASENQGQGHLKMCGVFKGGCQLSIASRPKMTAVHHFRHPKKCLQKMIQRGISF